MLYGVPSDRPTIVAGPRCPSPGPPQTLHTVRLAIACAGFSSLCQCRRRLSASPRCEQKEIAHARRRQAASLGVCACVRLSETRTDRGLQAEITDTSAEWTRDVHQVFHPPASCGGETSYSFQKQCAAAVRPCRASSALGQNWKGIKHGCA